MGEYVGKRRSEAVETLSRAAVYQGRHSKPGDCWVYDMARTERRMGCVVVPFADEEA